MIEVENKKRKNEIKLSKSSQLEWIDILKYPLITEKTTLLGNKNQYIFIVDPKTNKKTIKLAFEYVFNVKVSSVNTLMNAKKKVRRRGQQGFKARYKKAIVKLAQGFDLEFSTMEKANLGI